MKIPFIAATDELLPLSAMRLLRTSATSLTVASTIPTQRQRLDRRAHRAAGVRLGDQVLPKAHAHHLVPQHVPDDDVAVDADPLDLGQLAIAFVEEDSGEAEDRQRGDAVAGHPFDPVVQDGDVLEQPLVEGLELGDEVVAEGGEVSPGGPAEIGARSVDQRLSGAQVGAGAEVSRVQARSRCRA
jgi:hypothetical protein